MKKFRKKIIKRLTTLVEERDEAIDLIKYFIDRVEKGTIRSKKTYGMYKEFLDKLTPMESDIRCSTCIHELTPGLSEPCYSCMNNYSNWVKKAK